MLAPTNEREHTHETNETSRGAWAEVVMAARQGARRRAPVAAGVGSRSQARETGHEKKFNMEDAKSSRLARRRRRRRAVGLDVRGVCRVVTAKIGLGFPLRALLDGVGVREAAPGLPILAVVSVSPIRSKCEACRATRHRVVGAVLERVPTLGVTSPRIGTWIAEDAGRGAIF